MASTMPAPSGPGRRHKRRPMAEINVVPYIDVMLVLLVIFMVTAPILQQGVEVDLPQASASPIDNTEREPVIVSVDAQGNYYLTIADKPDSPIALQDMLVMVAAVMRRAPDTPILVKGDRDVPYGRVVEAMAYLQQAGVPKVGLMTETPRN